MNEAQAADGLDAAIEQRWNEQMLAAPVREPLWHAWTYRQPAVVLGRSQHRLVLPAGEGLLPLVRRGAGGGAVLVGPWLLSASLLLPPDDARVAAQGVTESYRWLGEAMVGLLAGLGVEARAVPPTERVAAPPALGWACFAGVAPWEVVATDPASGRLRKLVGFAQRRTRHGVLLALGVLMQPSPWPLLATRLGEDPAGADLLASATISLSELLAEPVPTDHFLALLASRLQPMRRMG